MIEELYGGKVLLKFSPKVHRYTVSRDGGVSWNSTQGVTTILGKVISKDGLMQWAANMAVEAMLAGEDPKLAKKAHTKKKDAGADIGTLVHNAIEANIGSLIETGTPMAQAFTQKEASLAYTAWLDWQDKYKPVFQSCERKVYSVAYNYSGTCDAVAIINGKRYLIDWKTANPQIEFKNGKYTGKMHAYPEHFIQVAAYHSAIEEETGESFDGHLIVYVTKTGKFFPFYNFDTAENITAWRGGLYLSRRLSALNA